MPDTADSGTMLDTGDGSALSEWSVVDQYGGLPDDDTTSSVESVDEDEDNTSKHSTPVASSLSSVEPRFVLRLPSHGHDDDVSDTDEDVVDPVDNPPVSHMVDARPDAGLCVQLASSNPPSISSAGLGAGQTYRQSEAIACVSMEELDELRQTIDSLKKNLQPSRVKDSSLSSIEMFGDWRSDNHGVLMETADEEQLSHRPVENISIHGNVLRDDVSMASSVSSSFLSKDEGTNCSLLRVRIDTADIILESPDDNQMQIERTDNNESRDNDQLEEQEGDVRKKVEHEEHGLKNFISIMSKFQVQFVVLAGLMCYTGLVIQLVLYCSLQGPAFQEKNAFSSFPSYNVELPSSPRDCKGAYSCHHGDDSCDITKDIELCKRDKEIESLNVEIERLRKQDKDASDTTVQVTFTLIRNDLDYSHIISDISKHKFTKEIQMILQDKEEQFKLLVKESNELTDKIKNAQRDFVNLTDGLVTIKDKKEKAKLSIEVEMDSQVQECRGLMAKQAELYSENERLQGMLIESRTSSTDWKRYLDQCNYDRNIVKQQSYLDVENVRRQSDREQYEVKRQCETDLDRVRKQVQANVQLSIEQCAQHTEQSNGHSGKETAVDQPNTKKEKDDNQSKKRNGNSSGRRNGDGNQSIDEEGQSEKINHSSSNSQKENYPGSIWADTVLDMMNKTREQIQDTWVKVKNMSESLWMEHQPTIHKLQDSFTRKLQNLSTRFQEKLMIKVNKWFRKDTKHEQQLQHNGPNANTKRRQFSGDAKRRQFSGDAKRRKFSDDAKRRKFSVDDHTIKSDITVELRLVELSQKVAELNARKFNKWRHGPKIIDIQREFDNVDLFVENDHRGMTDSQLKWFQCQFQWWKDLDVVEVSDDCYGALCCWQVKVTGGDVKQCRKFKRKLGIIEDRCTLELASKHMKHDQVNQSDKRYETKDEDHHETPPESNSYSQNTKDEMEEDRHGEADNQFFRHNNAPTNKDGKQKSPGIDGEDNWFLDMGEDREYHRGEPDNWFFRRKGKAISEDGIKSRFSIADIDLDDADWEEESDHGNLDL